MVDDPTRQGQTFGARLRSVRTARGYSQHQLAVRIGVSQRKLSDIEREKRPPLLLPSQLLAMAEALSVSVDQLTGIERSSSRPEVVLIVEHASALADSDALLLAQLAEHLATLRDAMPAQQPG